MGQRCFSTKESLRVQICFITDMNTSGGGGIYIYHCPYIGNDLYIINRVCGVSVSVCASQNFQVRPEGTLWHVLAVGQLNC